MTFICRTNLLNRTRLSSVQSSKFSTSMRSNQAKINHMTVIGAGLMGSGIAQVGIQSGLKVNLIDTSSKALENGLKSIQSSLHKSSKKLYPDSESKQNDFVEENLSKISTSNQIDKGLEKTDLIIEAIIENLKIKQTLFKTLEEVSNSNCILTSNTSSIKLSEISKVIGQERQSRVAGLHFFNPVPRMKLVEIIRTEQTDQSTIDSLTELCKRMGKAPVNCLDTPGFIVNRLLVPYLLEAMRMNERGEATIEDIDTAMKLGAGYPMGPFELSDYVGLDTIKHILDGWRETDEEQIGQALLKPLKSLNDLVSQGKLGRKSGEGFKKY
ncbi:uncharacterized protein MELLADRAFT_72978 [Melampsora larici-populina 98AG31]|uniref:3-hydroxyacyl-CoA dehydrogenase n=1 Tax=Melampsora larici-populina (strain 98AG31 / pathotype 3-4-7) TaxID=747676 RepID=F4S1K2_MELLP|nr:uncharacterized protein MELLADRAFT_72978 [Melampsora larici-populina 98AG31]EGG01390.1 hypothetical protein MELLADRAFT_72978 [Melampsora larici-populina 98AG31]